MEELNLEPTYSRKTSSSAISAVGSDISIESIWGLGGGSEPYVKLKLFHFYTTLRHHHLGLHSSEIIEVSK